MMKALRRGTPRTVNLSSRALVEMTLLDPGCGFPLVITPAAPDVDLHRWIGANAAALESLLLVHGAVLFRGFGIATAAECEALLRAQGGEPLEYRERSSPRAAVEGRIYTSTEHPADQAIFFHNENSYQHAWPLRIVFACAKPADEGGETPIASTRQVLRLIDPAIRRRFADQRVQYVRNFGAGFGLTWREVFQTVDREEVETYCRSAGIEWTWLADDRLRTRQVRPAIARHPRTGEPVWFNHAAFFHMSTLEPSLRSQLVEQLGEAHLPGNAYYGDGTPIEDDIVEEVRAAYRAASVTFPWQEGDALLLDNMLTAHARQPFKGHRRVLVGMSHRTTWHDVAEGSS
jgi:alpha-ketoglutarate-dependent taurine dioxygenase